jgi:hypothetical protein
MTASAAIKIMHMTMRRPIRFTFNVPRSVRLAAPPH